MCTYVLRIAIMFNDVLTDERDVRASSNDNYISPYTINAGKVSQFRLTTHDRSSPSSPERIPVPCSMSSIFLLGLKPPFGPTERLMVVSEHYPRCLADVLSDPTGLDVPRLAWELLHALHHLHQHQVVVRNLSTSTVRLDGDGAVKLAQFGLYYMTRDGEHVSFPIG